MFVRQMRYVLRTRYFCCAKAICLPKANVVVSAMHWIKRTASYTSSVSFADTCLAAARSRRGSDNPPGCHSTPRSPFHYPQGEGFYESKPYLSFNSRILSTLAFIWSSDISPFSTAFTTASKLSSKYNGISTISHPALTAIAALSAP